MYARCPGTGCEIWEAAAGDYDYKVETGVCNGCRQCGGNPPEDSGQWSVVSGESEDQKPNTEDQEIEDLVNDIADITAWEDAGFPTDWQVYDFTVKQLVRVWRSAEREITEIRDRRMQAFIKGFFKE